METKCVKWAPIGNPHRKWRQDRFIISTFNGLTDNLRLGIENAKEAGFTMIETGWGKANQTYAANNICAEVGMDILTQDVDIMGSFQRGPGVERGYYIREKLDEYLEKSKKNPHILGYYLWDEPISDKQRANAREQVDLFEELDPGRLGFTVANPSYGPLLAKHGLNFVTYIRKYPSICTLSGRTPASLK